MNQKTALQFHQVKKSFNQVQALKNIDFKVKSGEFFALLGPNGAGKTTLINCLNGLTKRDHGEILVLGEDPEKNPLFTKHALGIVEQELSFDPFFSPLEIMRLRRGLFGLRSDENYLLWLLEKLGLTDKKDERARHLSGGMKRRLMIAKALCHRPQILILDEPTAGVDVELRNMLYKFLRELNQEGMTIVLTTHYLEEAQLLADRIAIQKLGETLIVEKTDQLLQRNKRRVTVSFEDGEEAQFELGKKDSLRQKLESFGHQKIADLKIHEPSLEEVFLEITK